MGNTNMLWEPVAKRLVVIDHNQAFDPWFDEEAFVEHHVFASDWPDLLQDFIHRDDWQQRMTQALIVARRACDNAPLEWHWANAEQDVRAAYDPEDALRALARCVEPDFWRAQ